MTGAELRAWRERLGKDEAWGAGVCSSYVGVAGPVPACSVVASERRRDVEGEARRYAADDLEAMRAAYTAALEAEEARQAAEHGPVEPVCPEGVTVSRGSTGSSIYLRDVFAATVNHDGTLENWGVPRNPQHTSDVVAFVAAFMRYAAALHAAAASDRQRKLDAVKAAEDEYAKASHALAEAIAHKATADMAEQEAARAMMTARREAGL